MAPALDLGSLVIVEPVDPRALAVGEIVSLRAAPGTGVFTHRIVRIVERDGAVWIETKGDANASADPSILPATAVLGRVVLAVPYAGYLIALGSRPSGLVLIAAVGLLLITLGWVLDSGRRADPTPVAA